MSGGSGRPDEGRWREMPLVEQMANIGGEVERTIKWTEKSNPGYSRLAFERALDLIDMTMEDSKNRPSLKEIARLREAVVDFFAGENQFASSNESWRKYFLHFAYAARRGR